MNRLRFAGLAGIIAAGFLLVFASPASAHTSSVSHHETCTDSGMTSTVVTFDNDYNLAATVAYRWGAETPGTAHMAAKTGSANTTVSLPSHPVGTIAWHVTWTDSFRQPGSGESTLTVAPLEGCHPATTTTTAPAVTTTTKPSTTTTTGQATTTTAPTTATSAPATTTTAAPATTTTTAPTAILGTNETRLPRTGGVPVVFLVTCAALAVAVGAALRWFSRAEKT